MMGTIRPESPPVEVVHLCPSPGSGVTGCCGKTPFELPRSDRMTLHLGTVTCGLLQLYGAPPTKKVT
jgi:hypothetical protein